MVKIGTSGFSYDDWKGRFYPRDIKKSEMFSYYTRFFPTVEINSTYYKIPPTGVFATLAERAPDGFEFAVKLYKGLTHDIGNVSDLAEKFNSLLSVLADEGKLGPVLAQFPYSFDNIESNREYLLELKGLIDADVVVEFRNQKWLNDSVIRYLRDNEIGFCSIDEPFIKPTSHLTSTIGYIRFHGRNYDKWWHHNQPYERYDYNYTEEELRDWIPKVQDIVDAAKKSYIFFNNHFMARSPENADH